MYVRYTILVSLLFVIFITLHSLNISKTKTTFINDLNKPLFIKEILNLDIKQDFFKKIKYLLYNDSEKLIKYFINLEKNKFFNLELSKIFITNMPNNILENKLCIDSKNQNNDINVKTEHFNTKVNYDILWFISQPLFYLLQLIYKCIGNWGFSIIIITFIVRGIMYPITRSQYISMSKIHMLQPEIMEIKKKFINDSTTQNKEILSLYKRENINPLGGCLLLIIQMPIFLSLYSVLSKSIELRHAPFILWINDLSSKDPYYILPVIMGITMFFAQKSSSFNITDPIQQKITQIIPVIFTILFLYFPSGLVLYYIISNLFTIVQQYFIHQDLIKHRIDKNKKILKN